MKRSGKKRARRLIAALLGLALVGGGAYLKAVADYQREVRAMTFAEPDLGAIGDGTYEGMCDVGFIRARVAVTVRGGAITAVELLEHKNGRGAAAERITEAVTAEQRIGVDAVTGATNSSSVIKKAVENALAGA